MKCVHELYILGVTGENFGVMLLSESFRMLEWDGFELIVACNDYYLPALHIRATLLSGS